MKRSVQIPLPPMPVNTVARPPKLDHNAIVKAAGILKLAIDRSGIQQKVLGDDPPQVNKKLSGTAPDKLWFHEMLDWPPAVWRELLPLIALEVCPGVFTVERSLTIREVA